MKLEVAALKRKLLPLLILCLILIFNSCEGGEETTAPPETTGDPAIETAPTLVSGDGEAQYALILPENSNGDMRTAVNSFADKLTDLYGAKFEVKKNSSLAEGKNLIMIGAQEDTEYASYYADVPYRDYAVKITYDGNIVIAAWSLDAIGNCTSKLFMRLKSAFDAGDTVGFITDDILINGADTSMLDASIPQFSPSRMPRIYHIAGARGAFELSFKDSSVSDFEAYTEMLKINGFAEVQSFSGKDACFAVFTKESVEVTVNLWNKTGELLILVDKPTTEKPFKSDDVNATTVPKVIEPGLEYDGALKGTCYVIQASDGSFVIVDSGDSDPKFLDRLYSTLKSQISEGEKPHIRAWFITHAHGDHMNGLVDISTSKYASLIKCDAVYSNMPYESYQTAYDKSTYANRISKLEKAAKTLGAAYVTARTGQTYYFADIKVTVLGSVDDMLVTEFGDLDQTSLVFRAEAGGKSMIFSGDSGPAYIGQYINKRYTAETLKCDVVQATSHGQNGDALTEYYKMTDADYYLWSATKDFYGRHTPNKYIESDKSAKIIYSYDGAYTVELK